eukprot:UN27775
MVFVFKLYNFFPLQEILTVYKMTTDAESVWSNEEANYYRVNSIRNRGMRGSSYFNETCYVWFAKIRKFLWTGFKYLLLNIPTIWYNIIISTPSEHNSIHIIENKEFLLWLVFIFPFFLSINNMILIPRYVENKRGYFILFRLCTTIIIPICCFVILNRECLGYGVLSSLGSMFR